MRWEDESYVRWYRRNTPEWCLLSWQARGLFGLILREVDRAGLLELGKIGLKAVAVVVRAPWDEIEKPLSDLIEDGCIVHRDDLRVLLIPNFIAAQEANASDKARQRAARERARDLARAKSLLVAPPSQTVTEGHVVQPYHVTVSHENGQNRHSVLSVLPKLHTPSRDGGGQDVTTPEANRPDPDPPKPTPNESPFDLALRVFDELWSAKHKRAYVHSTNTGPKSESVALQKLGHLAVERGGARAEEFLRHWVRAYLRDTDAWPSDNGHPIRGLETRINKYGDPKKPRTVEPKAPAPEPPRKFTKLEPLTDERPVLRKPSTPEELAEEARRQKAALAAAFGNGKP